MTKKKLILYGAILIVFMLLFSLYTWILVQSQNNVNTGRLRESMDILENQMQKNLEYRAKDLQFELRAAHEFDETSLEEIFQMIRGLEPNNALLYVASLGGVLYENSEKSLDAHIDTAAIKAASSTGCAAVRYNGASKMAFIVPLSAQSPYFLVELYSPEAFGRLLWSNLSSVESRCFALFDEWGSVFTTLEDQAKSSDFHALSTGATAYCYNRSENAIRPQGLIGKYTAFFPVSQPENWFVGEFVDYSKTGGGFGVISPTIIMFVLFVLILTVVIVLDIVNDKQKRKELFLVSSVDQLTGLINSAGMQEAVSAFTQTHGGLVGFSFVCMDIVEFSRINSMFGYSVGDMLLRTVAGVIKDKYSCGTRTNADHFTFLSKTSENMAAQIESALYEAIEAQLGKEYLQMISFKFGVYPIQSARKNLREIYDGALLALKDAKRQSLQSEVIYDLNLQKTLELKKQIEINMMHALSKGEFLVYMQPQIQMADETCRRGEALIRWDSETIGFMSPDKFIPIFEGNGFIVETDFYVLTQVLELLAQRQKDGLPLPTIAVNQSKVTLSFPNYFERLKAITQRFSIPLNHIEIEITESTLENNLEATLPLIYSIKKLGFTISMDDFGAGYSSLNTLRVLPIDILKIDKAFLAESDTSERSKSIITSIIGMAKGLGVKVVCEGVETKQQLDFLREAGCDIIQGYYYSKPIPVEDFIAKYIDKKHA